MKVTVPATRANTIWKRRPPKKFEIRPMEIKDTAIMAGCLVKNSRIAVASKAGHPALWRVLTVIVQSPSFLSSLKSEETRSLEPLPSASQKISNWVHQYLSSEKVLSWHFWSLLNTTFKCLDSSYPDALLTPSTARDSSANMDLVYGYPCAGSATVAS